jgi:ribosome maturation factor RimP
MDWQRAVQGTVTGLGYELVDAQRSAGGLLRVFIDHAAELGTGAATGALITLDDCERVTRQLQHVLEVEGCVYQRLEVSSPGLDRPLKKPADFARFAGEQIDLTLRSPCQGRKRFRGELQHHAGAWRVVFGDAADRQTLDFSIEDVREARLVPVLDFKGRRFATAPAADDGRHRGDVEGDRVR